jgi:hypothetical protein
MNEGSRGSVGFELQQKTGNEAADTGQTSRVVLGTGYWVLGTRYWVLITDSYLFPLVGLKCISKE